MRRSTTVSDSSPAEDPEPGDFPTGWQHRVIYTRDTWSKGRLRYFAEAEDAEAFAEQLRHDDRPELATLVHLQIERRPVGRWEKRSVKLGDES
jgi:hypothetical protein